jgi:tRNA A-37 threonylcarbamoyl transferase component Bud32
MTKIQYRYLRDSLNLLHDNNISHGDLPGNVMLQSNNMPVIIDWEDAKLEADIIDKQIDTTAFLNHFRVKKI